MSKLLIFSIFFCLAFSLSCGLIYSSRPGAKEFYELDKLSMAQNTARINKFSSYPIERQIDIYLYANCCTEGGASGVYLTVDGEKKISNIVNRIEFSDDIRDKEALIQALFYINKDCKCMKKYPELIKRLETVAENFDSEKVSSNDNYTESYKNYYREYLGDIKNQME